MAKKRRGGKRKPYCYTDYPIYALGDLSGQEAPVRKVFPIMSDGDKMAAVVVPNGENDMPLIVWIKWGYLYRKPIRYPDCKTKDYWKHRYDVSHLEVDFDTWMSVTPHES